MIIIQGKNGSGKTLIKKKLIDMGYNNQISFTTRNIRPGEIDGVDYYFISKKEFEQKIVNNEIVDYQFFNNNYYGTPNLTYDNSYVSVKNEKGEIHKNDICFFIYAPVDIRYFRMLKRGDSPEEIFYRIHNENYIFLDNKPRIKINNANEDFGSSALNAITNYLNSGKIDNQEFSKKSNCNEILKESWPEDLKLLALEELFILSTTKLDISKFNKKFYTIFMNSVCKKVGIKTRIANDGQIEFNINNSWQKLDFQEHYFLNKQHELSPPIL